MISSRSNERIKTIRGLRKSKDEFAFLEGPRLLAELASSDIQLLEILATEDFLAGPAGAAIAARLGRPPLAVTASVLGSVAESATPQGVLAVARLPRPGIEGLPSIADGVYLFLDRMQDPGNLGAVVRSAEATGAAGVALAPGCAHPNHPKALRASGGSLLRMPIACGAGVETLLGHLARLRPLLIALVPSGGANLYETKLGGTLVLALGSEGPGLEAALAARADLKLTVPLAPPVESLNVTVAASVVLHELARRRRWAREAT